MGVQIKPDPAIWAAQLAHRGAAIAARFEEAIGEVAGDVRIGHGGRGFGNIDRYGLGDAPTAFGIQGGEHCNIGSGASGKGCAIAAAIKWRAVRTAGGVHHPTDGLINHLATGPVGERAVGAEGGDQGNDGVGRDRRDCITIGGAIDNHHVGGLRQLGEAFLPLGARAVERHRPLADVEMEKQQGCAIRAKRGGLAQRAARGRFDE